MASLNEIFASRELTAEQIRRRRKLALMAMEQVATGGAGGAEPGAFVPDFSRIATLGDSRIVASFDSTTTKVQLNASVPLNWANAMSGNAYEIVGQFGVAASMPEDARANIPAALALNPTALVFQTGVNFFVSANEDLEALWTTILGIVSDVKAASDDVAIVFLTDPGRGDFNASQIAKWHGAGGFNARLLALAASDQRVFVPDIRPQLLSSYDPIIFHPDVSDDELHYLAEGGRRAGIPIHDLFSTHTPDAAYPSQTGTDLLVNSAFAGTGGTPGTGNTGILPTSWTGVRDNANCSAAFSKNTRGDGAEEIVMALTTNNTTGTVGGVRVQQAVSAAAIGAFNAGDHLRGEVAIDIDAGSVLTDFFVQVGLNFTDTTFLLAYHHQTTSTLGLSLDMSEARSYRFRTPKVIMPAGKTLSTVTYQFKARTEGIGSSQSATVRFRLPRMNKLAA